MYCSGPLENDTRQKVTKKKINKNTALRDNGCTEEFHTEETAGGRVV